MKNKALSRMHFFFWFNKFYILLFIIFPGHNIALSFDFCGVLTRTVGPGVVETFYIPTKRHETKQKKTKTKL